MEYTISDEKSKELFNQIANLSDAVKNRIAYQIRNLGAIVQNKGQRITTEDLQLLITQKAQIITELDQIQHEISEWVEDVIAAAHFLPWGHHH